MNHLISQPKILNHLSRMHLKILGFVLMPASSRVVLGVTLGLYLLPILADLLFQGWERVFSYFAADTFYYLVVARNFAHSGLFSFDTRYPTNGFHPLWQVSLGLLYRLLDALTHHEYVLLLCVLGVSLGLISAALLLFGRILLARSGRISVWFILFPIGIYGLLVWPIFHRYGTLWSFSNGMESGVLLFFFGLLGWFFTREPETYSPRSDLLLGLLLSMIFLSRLDHIFLVPSFLFVELANLRVQFDRRKTLRRILIVTLVCAAVLFLYLIANKLYAGTWLPVSGSQKSTFPSVEAGNLKIDELKNLLSNPSQPNFGATAWRYCQIVFPVLFAMPVILFWLVGVIRKKRDSVGIFYASTALFVVILGLYNFFFVPTFDQGHWYFPVSITFMSLVCLDFLGRFSWRKLNTLAGMGVLVLVVCGYYAFIYHDSGYNSRYASFYHAVHQIKVNYRGEAPRILEYDDGIITYLTGFEGMSGFGFCLDKAGLEALSHHRLLDLAYLRGYRFIASSSYFAAGRFALDSRPEDIKNYLARVSYIGPEEVRGFRFRIDYVSSDGRFAIIAMEREK